jgi:hypothetical protein
MDYRLPGTIKGDVTMRAIHLQGSKERNRPGYALLVLLISVAIVFILFAIDLGLLPSLTDPGGSGEDTPWKEWRVVTSKQKDQQSPSELQPTITEAIRFDTKAWEESESRGKISIGIYPNGTVVGYWSGNYNKGTQVNCDITNGDFDGYIWPSKIYSDENGEDPSKLYFITKGRFLLQENNLKEKTLNNKTGDIYVTGWLNRNYSATGKITITSNQRYSETFNWESRRPVGK